MLAAQPTSNATPWALENLPPFSPVATRLITLLSNENVHVDQVSRFIAAEPVFSARLLQIANSPLFALQREVKSISQAVIVVGMERVKAIALTRALGDYIAPVLKRKALLICWRNTLAGALLAEKLAASAGLETEVAYTAGLLRDIGRLALIVKYPDTFIKVLAISQESQRDLISTEHDLFDIDHCQAGKWMVERMSMPAELADVIEHHHDPHLPEPFGLTHLIRAADGMADALGFAILHDTVQPCFEALLHELPEAVSAHLRLNPQDLKAEIEGKLQAWA